MPSPGIRLGVDFGTSNTVAVVRWPDGRSRPLLFDGSPLLPSAVYAEPAADGQAGALVVGRDAVHSARLDPARFEPNPKRRIDDGMVLLGDRELPVGEVVAAVLRRVFDEWRRTVGDVVPDVTLTFPASWGATRRLTLADAAAAAGLGRVRLVPEPVAAAAYFTQVLGRDVPIGSVVVVHDFGAGTFDASVVARTSSGFEVLAVDGRDDIGGIDIDAAIVGFIGKLCEERDPTAWQRLTRPVTVEDRRARRLLWDDARVAKERLSRAPSADLTVPLNDLDVHLTREELEDLARPLLEQTIRVTQGVIRWAQLAEGRVAGVFLVGGSSRIPLVATMLHRALGEAPVAIEQPELVVAEGSLVGGAAPTPVTAAPAPGPATGVLPRLNLSYPLPGSAFSGSAPSGRSGSAPPGSGYPGSGYPGSGYPVSGPPATPVSVPPARPVSAPPAGPVSAPPVSGPQSAPPVSGRQSAPPVGGRPVSSPPVSAPPGRSAGRVFVSGVAPVSPAIVPSSAPPVAPTRPMMRYEEPPGYAQQQQPVRQSRSRQRGEPRQGRGPLARAILAFLLVLLLIAVPLVACYLSYFVTTGGEWPPPVSAWLAYGPLPA